MSDYENRFDEDEVSLPFGYILDNCKDWDAFCEEAGLDPWLINEGKADSHDLHYDKLGIFRKHGILP